MTKSKLFKLMVVSIAFMLLAGALPRAGAGMGDQTPRVARVLAPDFKLEDVYAKPVTLSKYKGKVVLLDFWATTCGGCKVELPLYIEFEKKYKDKGLQLIGLDMYGESPDLIKPFMAKWRMDYPVAVGNDELGDRFGLKEMPLTLLIDRDGKVAVSHAGIVDKDKFEHDIQLLLQEAPGEG